jgi:hypothetical protein
MHKLTIESKQHAQTLPIPSQHLLLLSAMSSLYLSADEASLPHALPTTRRVLAGVGTTATPAMLILTLRRALRLTPRSKDLTYSLCE